MAKRLLDVETAEYSLEVYECVACGYHMGFDVTYLDQVEGNVTASCVACSHPIKTDSN